MNPGQILVGNHRGVHVIQMIGDVRLTLCMSFDKYIEQMFSDPLFTSVLFDMTRAQAVDSTTLGLMAKISLIAQERHAIQPVILAPSADIQRVLEVMGFNEIFTLVDSLDVPVLAVKPLHCNDCDEASVKKKIIEAHSVLMDLNAENRATFHDLMEVLKS